MSKEAGEGQRPRHKMAEKKEKKKEEAKIVLERVYNVPLRRRWVNVPKYKRAKKAVIALREFLMKHMKGKEVKLGKYVNEHLWKNGMKSPPHHVKVVVKKDDKGVVFAELEGAPVEEKKEEKKPEKKKEEKKPEKAERKEEEKAKKEEKAELKAIKKEKPKVIAKQPAAPKHIEKRATAPVSK